jgi:hypothetical protein
VKRAGNAELLQLQASQYFKIVKGFPEQPSSAFPVEAQGCLLHSKGTRIK